jgi:hypothetical protein
MSQSINDGFIRLSQSKLAQSFEQEDPQSVNFATIYRRKRGIYAALKGIYCFVCFIHQGVEIGVFIVTLIS